MRGGNDGSNSDFCSKSDVSAMAYLSAIEYRAQVHG